jgi:hypothetical protein
MLLRSVFATVHKGSDGMWKVRVISKFGSFSTGEFDKWEHAFATAFDDVKYERSMQGAS